MGFWKKLFGMENKEEIKSEEMKEIPTPPAPEEKQIS
jgi:hypothetical protein